VTVLLAFSSAFVLDDIGGRQGHLMQAFGDVIVERFVSALWCVLQHAVGSYGWLWLQDDALQPEPLAIACNNVLCSLRDCCWL